MRYAEKKSGANLDRPKLLRLPYGCERGHVLLVEQGNRCSLSTSPDWNKLRNLIDFKQVRIVALYMPTSWSLSGSN